MTLKAYLFLFFRTLLLSFLFFTLSLCSPLSASSSEEEEVLFPVSSVLRKRVDFWKKIYTDVENTEGLIHDRDDLSVIYEKISLPRNRWKKRNAIRSKKREINNILKSIYKKKFENLTEKEKVVLSKLPSKVSLEDLKRKIKNIRYQRGQKSFFRKGLIRSGKYLKKIQYLFSKSKVPIRLSYLPHVESSFNYKAYSKVGAAGIWQFTRSTGRIFMKVNYIIDERRDPIRATKAAIKLLHSNYKKLGTWPFAITAYNHGSSSIKRVSKRLKTKDLDIIIEQYKGRRFGFASKNFYASFIAASEVANEYQNYFGELTFHEPFEYSSLKLKKKHNFDQIRKSLNISAKTIMKYNPAIRTSARNSFLPLPKNYNLHVPLKNVGQLKLLQAKLNSLKAMSFASFKNAIKHRVSYGENLYTISRVYGVRMSNIIAFNELLNPHKIRPGLVIKIPNPLKQVKYSLSKAVIPKTTKAVALKVENNLDGYQLKLFSQKNNLYLITIEVKESIGLYADWLGIRAEDIRRLNGFYFGQPIRLGGKLLLRIDKSLMENFYIQRTNFHVGIQEDFYNSYTVVETIKYKVKRGDNFNRIMRKFELPLWLARKYQPKVDFNSLRRGQTIIIPMVEELEAEE